ncbi:MAG: transporter [Herbinix sp.]|jgi:RarD protein|nr:transporter [Herbinix sp.]
MKRSRTIYIIAMVIFGSIGLVSRNISLSSGQIALTRGVIGSIFLLAASRVLKEKLSWTKIKPNMLLLMLSGAGIGFNWILMLQAYQYTSIANATLSYYFAPVLVVILSPLLLKERLTPLKMCCILGALGGMFLIVGVGGGEGRNHVIGISYGLAAAVLYASVVIMNKFLKGLSGLETTFVQISSASVVLFPYILLTEKIEIFNIDRRSATFLIVLGLIHTGLAYLMYFTGMKKLKGQTVAVLSYTDPISAILMSSIFLGEELTLVQIFGGILILGATFLSEAYERRQCLQA